MRFPEKPIDLLSAVYNRIISADEAEDLMVEGNKRWHDGLLPYYESEYFGLSEKEYTAHGNAAGLGFIARWRYEGWPTQCHICKKPLDSDKYYWAVTTDAEGKNHLAHIDCMPKYECDEEEEDVQFDFDAEDE